MGADEWMAAFEAGRAFERATDHAGAPFARPGDMAPDEIVAFAEARGHGPITVRMLEIYADRPGRRRVREIFASARDAGVHVDLHERRSFWASRIVARLDGAADVMLPSLRELYALEGAVSDS